LTDKAVRAFLEALIAKQISTGSSWSSLEMLRRSYIVFMKVLVSYSVIIFSLSTSLERGSMPNDHILREIAA
jgi:hypothetical protein